jgi:ABC-2 type transport system permease protein/oleandomycin transport system permease protein
MVVIANASNSAVGIASDLTSGMLDRLRAMPVRSWTVLVGRSTADTIVSVGQVAIVSAVAVALGFAPDGSIPEVLAGVGLIVFLGLAFNGLFMIFGAAIRNPESVNAAASALLFPLLFVSSAFAPPETMPSWMRAVAEANPLSLVADASRGLFAGAPNSSDILSALIGTTAVLVVGMIRGINGVSARQQLSCEATLGRQGFATASREKQSICASPQDRSAARFVSRYHRMRIRETSRHPA